MPFKRILRLVALLAVIILTASVAFAGVQPAHAAPPASAPAPAASIRFTGPYGSAPDPAVWNHELGGGGWGNREPQTYVNSRTNSRTDGYGNLAIRATPGKGGDLFHSARLTTEGKFHVQPGSYVEAQIIAPTGRAIWPAFWTVGADIDQVGWPKSGEIDILEGRGEERNKVSQALHMAAADNPRTDLPYGWGHPGATTTLPDRIDASWHTYGVYFDQHVVRFYIDRVPRMEIRAADAVASGRDWPFGKPQFLILNLALTSKATPEETNRILPKTMKIHRIDVWNGVVPPPGRR